MAEITAVYRQSLPAMRFIGKCYGDEQRSNADGTFSHHWEDWFANNWFEPLEAHAPSSAHYEDTDATIGVMRAKEGEPFEYWIGMFCTKDAPVPKGYRHLDFDAMDLGVVWLRDHAEHIYGNDDACAKRLTQDGYAITSGKDGAMYTLERYACPRFTTPDEQGSITLDICFPIEEK